MGIIDQAYKYYQQYKPTQTIHALTHTHRNIHNIHTHTTHSHTRLICNLLDELLKGKPVLEELFEHYKVATDPEEIAVISGAFEAFASANEDGNYHTLTLIHTLTLTKQHIPVQIYTHHYNTQYTVRCKRRW